MHALGGARKGELAGPTSPSADLTHRILVLRKRLPRCINARAFMRDLPAHSYRSGRIMAEPAPEF